MNGIRETSEVMLSEREEQRVGFNIPEPRKCQMMQNTSSFKHLLSK